MPRESHPRSLNVLFIGNSFTARNNLPGLIARMAQARGLTMEHRLISAGGASLRMHWNKGDARAAIRDGGYDYVVLQEQSTLPVKNAERMKENVRLFDEVIRAAGSKTALYLTWARQHTPDAQEAITDAYTSVGRELGAAVVPVGVVWQAFLRKHDSPILYDKDGSHPSAAGSYLAACVFLRALCGQDPLAVGVDVGGVTPAEAELLQRAARAAA